RPTVGPDQPGGDVALGPRRRAAEGTSRRPILLPKYSVNQRLPSGPAAISPGKLPDVGIANSVMAPAGVIRPIRLPSRSVNQRLPSGPAVIPPGALRDLGIGNSVMVPLGVIRPIRLP